MTAIITDMPDRTLPLTWEASWLELNVPHAGDLVIECEHTSNDETGEAGS